MLCFSFIYLSLSVYLSFCRNIYFTVCSYCVFVYVFISLLLRYVFISLSFCMSIYVCCFFLHLAFSFFLNQDSKLFLHFPPPLRSIEWFLILIGANLSSFRGLVFFLENIYFGNFFMNLNGHCGFNDWFSHWCLFLLQFCLFIKAWWLPFIFPPWYLVFLCFFVNTWHLTSKTFENPKLKITIGSGNLGKYNGRNQIPQKNTRTTKPVSNFFSPNYFDFLRIFANWIRITSLLVQ